MTKFKFKTLPDTTTPITGENLNKLNNLAIDTSVGTHDEEVVLVKSNNLFNKNNVENNKGIASSNGTTYDTSGYSVSEYIYLKKGKYIGTGFNRYASYDTSKTFIKSELATSFELTADSYVRLQLQSVNLNTAQLNKGTTLLPYDNWKQTEIYANGEKYTDTINIGAEHNNSGLWLDVSENLITKDLTFTNQVLNGWNDPVSSSTRILSSVINVKNGKTYTIKCKNGYKVCVFGNGSNFYNSGWKTTDFEFTTNYTEIRVMVGFTNDSAITPSEIQNADVVLKENKPASIKVNNNGVYETIVNKQHKIWSGSVYAVNSTMTLSEDLEIGGIYMIEYSALSSVYKATDIFVCSNITNEGAFGQINYYSYVDSAGFRYRINITSNKNELKISNAGNTAANTAITAIYKIGQL